MKQLIALLALCGTLGATAQTKTAAKKPAAKTASVSPLKTTNDSVSYAIGVMAASFYKQQGISKLNGSAVSRAISDVSNGKQLLLSDAAANEVLMRYMNGLQQEKAAPTIKAGETFLAQNKTKAGVKTTASGLQYEVVTQGSGPTPSAADTVVCHYRGALIDGTEFDNSYKRGEPLTIPVSGVIRGWTEGLQLMPVGSKYKLYIPQELAYGPKGRGPIPGGATLLFTVELIAIDPAGGS